jgi:hypothetical protein
MNSKGLDQDQDQVPVPALVEETAGEPVPVSVCTAVPADVQQPVNPTAVKPAEWIVCGLNSKVC